MKFLTIILIFFSSYSMLPVLDPYNTVISQLESGMKKDTVLAMIISDYNFNLNILENVPDASLQSYKKAFLHLGHSMESINNMIQQKNDFLENNPINSENYLDNYKKLPLHVQVITYISPLYLQDDQIEEGIRISKDINEQVYGKGSGETIDSMVINSARCDFLKGESNLSNKQREVLINTLTYSRNKDSSSVRTSFGSGISYTGKTYDTLSESFLCTYYDNEFKRKTGERTNNLSKFNLDCPGIEVKRTNRYSTEEERVKEATRKLDENIKFYEQELGLNIDDVVCMDGTSIKDKKLIYDLVTKQQEKNDNLEDYENDKQIEIDEDYIKEVTNIVTNKKGFFGNKCITDLEGLIGLEDGFACNVSHIIKKLTDQLKRAHKEKEKKKLNKSGDWKKLSIVDARPIDAKYVERKRTQEEIKEDPDCFIWILTELENDNMITQFIIDDNNNELSYIIPLADGTYQTIEDKWNGDLQKRYFDSL